MLLFDLLLGSFVLNYRYPYCKNQLKSQYTLIASLIVTVDSLEVIAQLIIDAHLVIMN